MAVLVWNINEKNKLTLDSGFSRQGNIYNGDTQNSSAGLDNNKNYLLKPKPWQEVKLKPLVYIVRTML